MSPIAEKHKRTVENAIERMISRAVNARGLQGTDLYERVVRTLDKYLVPAGSEAANSEIEAFIDEIHADDLCLIVACEKGDESAWGHLVASFDATVQSAARRISSNNEDAEDLASSIWAELYGLRQDADGNKKSKLAYYSGRGSLGGWLRAVVGQLAVDQFRKQSKFVQLEDDREFENLANETAAGGNNHFASHSADPEAIFTEGQTTSDVAAALSSAIATLDAEDRLILKLYYFEDLKLKDIAATFGFHEATASRRLVRIQADVRKMVEKNLCEHHGWTTAEVKRYLSDAAASLGVNLETMLAIMLTLVMVQDLWG